MVVDDQGDDRESVRQDVYGDRKRSSNIIKQLRTHKDVEKPRGMPVDKLISKHSIGSHKSINDERGTIIIQSSKFFPIL